ncbi:hypothetical protein D0867_02795 [Hortaea werneckii]|uniref:HMG box domain-containing protein n=1 Tax=Hortaea werneckii TaxID=91943 RepID=A0A3M7A4X5_HORWE|nr:hypothetical protein D0867_02795 [Hortaea werneckii]
MADSTAVPCENSPSISGGQLLRGFVDAFDSVQAQLKSGITQAVVPLTQINLLGPEGAGILKKHLEDATNSRFSLTVNAIANSVILMPIGPMPPKPSVTAQGVASAGKPSKGSNPKVPRPPNAFIIYRKDWHARVVAENPGLHNNAISVIIGRQWRAESETVRAAYTRRAEDMKEQHAIANPGYQYQPRKPSEKKKRMTKNKLAKLAAKAQENGIIDGSIAQQTLPDDFDPVAMLDQQLGACAANQPMDVSSFGNVPAAQPPTLNSTTEPFVLTFESNTQDYRGLAESLAEFNATHSYPNGPCENNSAIGAQPIANGQWLENVVQHDLPGVGFYLPDSEYPQNQDNGLVSEQWNETQDHDPLVELARTAALEWEFDDFIDFHGEANTTRGRVDGQSGVQDPNSLLTQDNEADNSASAMQATQSKTGSPVSAHFENAVKN